MCNMELNRSELSLIVLGMETLMEQLKDDGIRDVLDEKLNRKRYYDCWDIADKAQALLSQK